MQEGPRKIWSCEECIYYTNGFYETGNADSKCKKVNKDGGVYNEPGGVGWNFWFAMDLYGYETPEWCPYLKETNENT